MKKLFMVLPLVFLLCFSFGCQQAEEVAEEPAVDVEADIAAIKGLLDKFVVSINDGDSDGLVALYYAEDAVRMPPNELMVKGKAAILSWFKKGDEQYTRQLDLVAEDIQVDRDLAYMRGTGSGTFTPKAEGEILNIQSKWMAVYKRQADGSWKCIADVFNSDIPVPSSSEKE